MQFIAAYGGPERGAEDQQLARIARTWHSILRGAGPVHGIVDRLLDELCATEGGCGWEDLRRRFIRWALDEEWIEPSDPRAGGNGPPPSPPPRKPTRRPARRASR